MSFLGMMFFPPLLKVIISLKFYCGMYNNMFIQSNENL